MSAGELKACPKHGDLQVWWVPQIPMTAFKVDVADLRTASLLLDVLAEYDAFQFEHNVKPDYCNIGGLSQFDGDGADWFDWEDPDTGDGFDEVRRDPERLAALLATPATTPREQELVEALEAAVRIADEARDEWDAAPSGMKAGKLLIALSGHLPGYRADIDAIHRALQGTSE